MESVETVIFSFFCDKSMGSVLLTHRGNKDALHYVWTYRMIQHFRFWINLLWFISSYICMIHFLPLLFWKVGRFQILLTSASGIRKSGMAVLRGRGEEVLIGCYIGHFIVSFCLTHSPFEYGICFRYQVKWWNLLIRIQEVTLSDGTNKVSFICLPDNRNSASFRNALFPPPQKKNRLENF